MSETGYRERRRRRRLRGVFVVGLAAAAVLTVLAAREPAAVDPCVAPAAASSAELAHLPAGLSFDRIGTVTRVLNDGTNITAQAVTTKPLDEVTVAIQDAVTAAGYRPAGMDNEGFEAEVFFTTSGYAAGQARVERSACPGRWEIALVLLDRDAARMRSTTG